MIKVQVSRLNRKRLNLIFILCTLSGGVFLHGLSFAEPIAGNQQCTRAPNHWTDQVFAQLPKEIQSVLNKTQLVIMNCDSKSYQSLLKRLMRLPNDRERYAEELLLRAHHFIDANESYQERLIEDIMKGSTGIYDPSTRVIYIRSQLTKKERNRTLLHELIHAWQDVHWDLGQRLLMLNQQGSDRYDERLALRALLEGSTQFIIWLVEDGSLTHVNERISWFESQRLTIDHSKIKALLLEPYLVGLRYTQWVMKSSWSWKYVSLLYESVPSTTADILHPRRRNLIKDQEYPSAKILVQQSQQTQQDSMLWEGQLGELHLRILLSQTLDLNVAFAAAEGWIDDWTYVIGSPQAQLSCTLSIWDSAFDALDFERAISNWFKQDSRNPKYSILRNKNQVSFCLSTRSDVTLNQRVKTLMHAK